MQLNIGLSKVINVLSSFSSSINLSVTVSLGISIIILFKFPDSIYKYYSINSKNDFIFSKILAPNKIHFYGLYFTLATTFHNKNSQSKRKRVRLAEVLFSTNRTLLTMKDTNSLFDNTACYFKHTFISGLDGSRTRVQKPIRCPSTIIVSYCEDLLPCSRPDTEAYAHVRLVASCYARSRKA